MKPSYLSVGLHDARRQVSIRTTGLRTIIPSFLQFLKLIPQDFKLGEPIAKSPKGLSTVLERASKKESVK
jgi:hypothetical protein